jgi:hypothetical protein
MGQKDGVFGKVFDCPFLNFEDLKTKQSGGYQRLSYYRPGCGYAH